MGCAPCEAPEHSLRLRTDDRRTDPRCCWRMAAALTSSPVAAPLARANPGVGTFVAVRKRRHYAEPLNVRTYAQSRADIACLRLAHSLYGEMRIDSDDSSTRACVRPVIEALPHHLPSASLESLNITSYVQHEAPERHTDRRPAARRHVRRREHISEFRRSLVFSNTCAAHTR